MYLKQASAIAYETAKISEYQESNKIHNHQLKRIITVDQSHNSLLIITHYYT